MCGGRGLAAPGRLQRYHHGLRGDRCRQDLHYDGRHPDIPAPRRDSQGNRSGERHTHNTTIQIAESAVFPIME